MARRSRKRTIAPQVSTTIISHANRTNTIPALHPGVDSVMMLQRTIGNRAVGTLLHSGMMQTKLKIGMPGDKYEQQADSVANQVVSMPEPSVQTAPEEEKKIQTSPVASTITPFVQTAAEKKEEVQKEPLDDKREDGALQRAAIPEDEKNEQPIMRKSESEPEEELPIQGKADPDGGSVKTAGNTSHIETGLSAVDGGRPLSEGESAYFESRFGTSFDNVRLHTDTNAAQLSRELNAQAFTVGSDVYFGAGKYDTESSAGKRLMAHELTHVVQQNGERDKVQAQHTADTGWRYTPPATVTRSIVEIQGTVGATPDGIYGPNTRDYVKKYQNKLKALGLYTKNIDGKWGSNTDTAHTAFATGPFYRRGYNCAGFAFKTYQFHSMPQTKGILGSMTKMSSCSNACPAWNHKFWYWECDVSVTDTTTGATTPNWRDFHIVGGQTDKNGTGPSVVMSKNGPRPVEGPQPPLTWMPVSGPVIGADGNPVPGRVWNISNRTQDCYCTSTLP